MNKQPLVSVIMPVYRAENFIGEAIESVLAQTYTNWELLIISDCCPDRSMEVAARYGDERIKLTFCQSNMGPARARNLGIRVSSGDYLAMLDADDISLPQRLEAQVDFLSAHPEIGLCGTAYRYFGAAGHTPRQPFLYDGQLRTLFAFFPGFHLATIMFRRSLAVDKGLLYWDEEGRLCEDYDLCLRACEQTKLAVLEKCLYLYRRHEGQATVANAACKRKTAELAAGYLFRQLEKNGVNFTAEDRAFYTDMSSESNLDNDAAFFAAATSICSRLLRENHERNVFIPEIFSQNIALRWYRAVKPGLKSGAAGCREVMNAPPFRQLAWDKKLGALLRLFGV